MYALRAHLRLIMLDRRRTFGGDVLHERSPERDVGDLDAPADRQRRQTPFVRQAHERQLILVARAMRRVGFRADGGAVLRRIDVLAARQDHAADRVEHRPELVRVDGRKYQRRQPRGSRGKHVGLVQPHAHHATDFFRGRRERDESSHSGSE